jgi:nucleoside-diphosphate-sugar epimerase
METSARLAVTGVAGHLGSHLVRALLAAGYEVAGIDVEAGAPEGCRFVQGDLSDPAALRPVLEGADAVIHCASIHPWKTYPDPLYLDANVKGTWMLYAAAAERGIERVLLTSSIAAVGYVKVPVSAWPVGEADRFPLGDLYSFTKHAQEDIARLYADDGKIRTVALRPPAFMPMPELETLCHLTGAFAVVDDIVAAHLAALARLLDPSSRTAFAPFEAFNVTNRLPYRTEDVPRGGAHPNTLALARKYWPDACSWMEERGFTGVGLSAVYDISKAEEKLGWRPALNFEQMFSRLAGRAP